MIGSWQLLLFACIVVCFRAVPIVTVAFSQGGHAFSESYYCQSTKGGMTTTILGPNAWPSPCSRQAQPPMELCHFHRKALDGAFKDPSVVSLRSFQVTFIVDKCLARKKELRR